MKPVFLRTGDTHTDSLYRRNLVSHLEDGILVVLAYAYLTAYCCSAAVDFMFDFVSRICLFVFLVCRAAVCDVCSIWGYIVEKLKVATTTPHLQWLVLCLPSPEVHAAVVLAQWIDWLISSISALPIDRSIQSKGSVVKG